jgi:hypothetical protein
MATKQTKKKVAKKKSKPARRAKAVKRAAAKKSPKKHAKSVAKIVAKKTLKKAAVPKNTIAKKAVARKSPARKIRGKADGAELISYQNPGRGADTGGQSGDTQGVSDVAETDSESVKELLEEGQAYEAEVVGGVENVPDADEGEVRTHEVPEDDVPEEYRGEGAQK